MAIWGNVESLLTIMGEFMFKKINFRKSIFVIGVLIQSLFISVPGFSASLSIGDITAAAGATNVSVPISIAVQTGDDASGLDMTVAFSSSALQFSGVEIGAASDAANKTLASNSPSAGIIKLVIYSPPPADPNTTLPVLQNGVIANLIFNIPTTVAAGEELDISISDFTISDNAAVKVASQANTNGKVTVTSDTDPGTGPDNDPDPDNDPGSSNADNSGSSSCFISTLGFGNK